MIQGASVTLLDSHGLWILTGPGLRLIIVTDDSGADWAAAGEVALRGLGLPVIAVSSLAERVCALAAHAEWHRLDHGQRTLLCEPEAWEVDAGRWPHSCTLHPVRERVPARLPHACGSAYATPLTAHRPLFLPQRCVFGREHEGHCVLGSQADYPFLWTRIVQRHGEDEHEGCSLAELEGWEGLGHWWIPTPEDIGQDDSESAGIASDEGSTAAEGEGESLSSELDSGSDGEWVDSDSAGE